MQQLAISLFYETVSNFIILWDSKQFCYFMQQLTILLFYGTVICFIIL